MSYYITTDATCDLPKEYYGKDFHVIPMAYMLDGEEYGIDKFLSSKEFYTKMENGSLPTTSLITTYYAKEQLTPFLEEGKDILHICFSSGLSGTYQSLELAVKELREEFPKRKIMLIDSKSATMGEGLLNIIAMKNRENGMSIEENYANISELVDKTVHYATVADLFHLQRGGRMSKAAAIFGTVLNIKPLIYCNVNGKLVAIDKIVSRKKALLNLVDKYIEHKDDNYAHFPVVIGHGNSAEDAEFVKKKLEEKAGVTNAIITDVGPVIGSHTGSGVVVIMFIGDTRIDPKDETISH